MRVLSAGMAALVLLLAAATWVGAKPAQDAYHEGDGALAYVAWNVTDTHVEVALLDQAGLRWNATPADVIVMLGTSGQQQPTEWYVVHFGATMTAASHDGQTLDVSTTPDGYAVERTQGEAGDCARVWAESWQAGADGKQVADTLPEGRSIENAWDGTCDAGAFFNAPAAKGSPAPGAVLAGALLLLAVAWRR